MFKILTTFLLAFSVFANAEEQSLHSEELFDWSEKYESATYIPSLDERELVIRSSIYHNNAGEKIIILDLTISDSEKHEYVCPSESTNLENIGYFNGQAIKIAIKCVHYTDKKEVYLSLTPRTNAGLNFVVQALMDSPEKISFQYHVPSEFIGKGGGSYDTYISAKGFARAWRKFGDNAL